MKNKNGLEGSSKMVCFLTKQGNEMIDFCLKIESGFEGVGSITTTQTFSKCLPRGLSVVIVSIYSMRKDILEGTMGV